MAAGNISRREARLAEQEAQKKNKKFGSKKRETQISTTASEADSGRAGADAAFAEFTQLLNGENDGHSSTPTTTASIPIAMPTAPPTTAPVALAAPTPRSSAAPGSRRAAREAEAAALAELESSSVVDYAVPAAERSKPGKSSKRAQRAPKSRTPKSRAPKNRPVDTVSPARARIARAEASAAVKSPRTKAKRGGKGRIAVHQALSVTALLGAAALFVTTSVPASAFSNFDATTSAAQTSVVAPSDSDAVQSVTVNAQAAEDAAVAAPVERDTYAARSYVQQIALLRGNPNYSYTNNPNGTIQWPFPAQVPISSGFGARSVCSYCSTYHLGVDFTPGAGVPIQAITAGVVSDVILDSGGLGNHVIIDHVVNGQNVQSVYAHMAWGSIQVAVGQQVQVGTIVGAVGSTGASTGAHLHLEIHIDGTPVDPFAWLKSNAN